VEHQTDQFDERNETNFSDEFGMLTQAAFLMSAVAQMEHHLKKVCDIISELRNLRVRPADLVGGKGFESCVAYLTKVSQLALSASVFCLPKLPLRLARIAAVRTPCPSHFVPQGWLRLLGQIPGRDKWNCLGG
jgi:hypothetical protein